MEPVQPTMVSGGFIAAAIAAETKGKNAVECLACVLGPWELPDDLPILELRIAYCPAYHKSFQAVSHVRHEYEKLRILINKDEKKHGEGSKHVSELRMKQEELRKEHAVLYKEFCELYTKYKTTFDEMGGDGEKKIWRHYAGLLKTHPKLIDMYKNIEFSTPYY